MSEISGCSTLIGLPGELRLSILDYLIPRDAGNRKTITMPLFEGLRHSEPDNIHIHDMYPSRLSLRRYLKGIGLVNRQLHNDAMVLLYDRTFIITIGIDPKRSSAKCIADYAANWTIPMQWQVLLPGLDVARVKELRIQAVPSTKDVTWESIQWRLESFCRILGRNIGEQGLKKVVVDIAEMQKSTPLVPGCEFIPWISVSNLDPPIATAEDVVRLLQPVWLCLSNVKACEIVVPDWASSDQWVVDAVKETKDAIRLSWEDWNELVESGQIQDTAAQGDQCEWDNVYNPDGANEQGDPESVDAAADDTNYNYEGCQAKEAEEEEEKIEQDGSADNDSESEESEDWPRWNPNDEEEPEDLCAKREGEQWDDFYLLPPSPRYVVEYQLRDSVWIFGEEPQVESSETDWA